MCIFITSFHPQDEKIWSVRDALDNLGLRESLQGFTCNKTKMEVNIRLMNIFQMLEPYIYIGKIAKNNIYMSIDQFLPLELNRYHQSRDYLWHM